MPKRELSKCREWERERRERLKTCFEALSRLLPSHDPSISPSKLEILQRAAQHITDLQQKNKELLLGDQKATQVGQRDEIRRLRERVKKLNARNEQLAGLLKSAGLKVPKECLGRQNGVFKGPPKLWSGKLSKEKAEILRKKHEICESPRQPAAKRKRKRVSSVSGNKKTDNNEPPLKKPTKKPAKKSLTTSSANLASKVATVLGPGTLILANGSVVPVPGPPATLHRIQLVPTVQQSNQQVILMQQRSKLPILRPKSGNFNKQNLVAAKIAIPPLPKKKNSNKKTKNNQKIIAKPENKPEIEAKAAENKNPETEKVQNVEKTIEKPSEKELEVKNVEENIKKIDSEPEKEAPSIEAPKLPEKPENEPNLLQEPQVSETEISNDIFASLGTAGDSAGVIGAQHTESMSPTAAFLLAFPLVSTLTGNRMADTQNSIATGSSNIINNSNNNNSERDANEDDRQSTPTLLQIGGDLPEKNIEINKSRNILHQISENTKETANDFRYFNQNNEQINRQNRDLNPEPQTPAINACLYEKNSTNANQFYPYSSCTDFRPPETCQKSAKNRSKTSSQRAPVNWMTTPDIRPNSELPVTGNATGTNDYFLPPFSDVYSGILTQEINQNSDQNYNWNSNRSVLPTLLGDLALGVTSTSSTTTTTNVNYTNSSNKNNSNYYNNLFDPPNLTAQFPQQNKENSGSFLSVSSILVGGKARKSHNIPNNQNVSKKRDKHKSTRSNNHINDNFENHKKYSGGYSAEELIGETPYQLSDTSTQQFYHHKQDVPQNQPNQAYNTQQQAPARQNAAYGGPQRQQQQAFGATYPSLPPTGEFSALLSAAVVDSYSKTFDSFVHVKPSTGFEGYSNRTETQHRRHSRRSGAPGTNPTNTTTANPSTGFSDLSFLSMSGAVNSPMLPDDFHSTAPFLNAPPPIPTPAVSSLTNFNLSAIFPEINKGTSSVWPHSKPAVTSGRSQTRYQQNQQVHEHHNETKPSAGYCHPQQHQHGPPEALYGGGTPVQSFPGILSHHQAITSGTNSDVNSAPTNFSFSFAAP